MRLLPRVLLLPVLGFWSAGTTAFVAQKWPSSRAAGSCLSLAAQPPPPQPPQQPQQPQQPDLEERFDRWRYLQKLLDEETEPALTNQLLYRVLDGYAKYPRPKFELSDATGSPERTHARLQKITRALALGEDGAFSVLSDPQQDVADDLIASLEALLPDPVAEEDDNQGTWDTIMELHGRESVKINQQQQQQQPTSRASAWKARCLTARLLIYYDFLQLGVVDQPFEPNEHEHENLAP
jgi:hypothetical protein